MPNWAQAILHPRRDRVRLEHQRCVAHIDADCFYVSCEQLKNPALKGKEVCVLSSQDACVIAKSYEAKAKGVKTGMTVWEAKRKASKAIYLSADFGFYGKVSERLFLLFRTISPEVEVYSIDEGFMNVTGLDVAYEGSYRTLAESIRERVAQEIGITVSVGVAPTKTLAKLASEFRKPNGVTVVAPHHIEKFLSLRDVEDIWGIGSRRGQRLKELRIKSALDLWGSNPSFLRRLMGKGMVDLWRELHGEMVYPLETKPHLPKSISRTASLGRLSRDRDLLWSSLVYHARRVSVELVTQHLMANHVALFLRQKDFSMEAIEVKLPLHTHNYHKLIMAVQQGFERIFQSGTVYRGCGVTASGILSTQQTTGDLFETGTADVKSARVTQTMASLNRKYGRGTVTYLTELPVRHVSSARPEARLNAPLLVAH
jgi:DNA polymerase V